MEGEKGTLISNPFNASEAAEFLFYLGFGWQDLLLPVDLVTLWSASAAEMAESLHWCFRS